MDTIKYLRNINKAKWSNQNNTKNTKNIIKLPRVPILAPKLQKKFKKKDIKAIFTSGVNRSPSCVKISQNFSLILTQAFTH